LGVGQDFFVGFHETPQLAKAAASYLPTGVIIAFVFI